MGIRIEHMGAQVDIDVMVTGTRLADAAGIFIVAVASAASEKVYIVLEGVLEGFAIAVEDLVVLEGFGDGVRIVIDFNVGSEAIQPVWTQVLVGVVESIKAGPFIHAYVKA